MDHTNSLQIPSDTFQCNSTDQCDTLQSLNLARNAERKTRQKNLQQERRDIAVSFIATGNAVTCVLLSVNCFRSRVTNI